MIGIAFTDEESFLIRAAGGSRTVDTCTHAVFEGDCICMVLAFDHGACPNDVRATGCARYRWRLHK